jgi:hypothetical protein
MSPTRGDHDPASAEARRALRSLRVDPPDDGFSSRLRERLVAAGPPPAPGIWGRLGAALAPGGGRLFPGLLWPAAGVLAGAATFLLLGLGRGPTAGGLAAGAGGAVTAAAGAEAVHRIPSDKIAVIRLNFAAEVAIHDVAFEVRLPEGLAFWSEGHALAERSFLWHGDLFAGDNPLPIAVRGERPGRYRVVTTAEIDGRRIEHAVLLEVTGA